MPFISSCLINSFQRCRFLFPHFLRSHICVTFHFSRDKCCYYFSCSSGPLRRWLKPLFDTCRGSVSLFSIRLSTHTSHPCPHPPPPVIEAQSIQQTICLFTLPCRGLINTTPPAGIFLLLVIRTFIISHMSRCVWCSPPSQTSKSFTPSLMSIRKDWSVSGFSTRS